MLISEMQCYKVHSGSENADHWMCLCSQATYIVDLQVRLECP